MKKILLLISFAFAANDAPAVTCPLAGTCDDTNYKTVANNASCGNDHMEVGGVTLVVSGTYSDDRGIFTHTGCAAN